ncbi:hypothetical protein HDU78_011856 [Chytriomyces hyalinus]|nr:hypothetical protein HDU78_011856 [Chytriomyces hyalinus]
MQHVLIFHLKGAARSGGKQWKATHKRLMDNPILLFHGERDIWIERNLHTARDGKPNTLTLIKLKTGTIFGGYSAAAWTNQSPRVCIDSFVFLIAPSGAFLRLPFRNSGAGILGGPYNEPMSGTNGSTYKLFVNEHSLTAVMEGRILSGSGGREACAFMKDLGATGKAHGAIEYYQVYHVR